MTTLSNIACGDAPEATADFAISRRFIAALPAITDPDLAQAVEHLKDALNFIDRLQSQKPVAYVSSAKLERLDDHRIATIGASLAKSPWPGSVPVYAEPFNSTDEARRTA
jgi:hypothetical protein